VPDLPFHGPGSDSGYPVRSEGQHRYCLNNHDLQTAGMTTGFDHAWWLSTTTCETCRALKWPRATWCEVDHRRLVGEKPSTHAKLVLAARRPALLGGIGQLEVLLREAPIADMDVRMCPVDERGVIEQVRVDEPYRRRGFGVLLVEAALARGPGYRWSTTVVSDSAEARSFWASRRIPAGLELGVPFWCSHMREADGEFV
jgi:GNAT superfamily N-acetyltransferase